ncbi:MAG TPA: hypothetical protein VFH73_27995 [Polyangia bacterium]|jgi:hypothetical protein|nr:hypothetical protein [Polyangia bacterium]
MDRLKGGAGLVAAVVGSMTALFGVYEKVRSDAKEYTATSYDTLAPKLNEMNDALKRLQQENQQLKEAVVGHAVRLKPAATATARPSAKPTHATATGDRPAAEPAAEPVPPPAGAAAAPAPTAPAAQATAESAPSGGQPNPLNDIFGAVTQARDAVQNIRKVPETFEKALQQKK